MLIVQKFGGSSVANAQRIRNVAGLIAESFLYGNDVVVVLSAQGDTTDDLLEKAAELNRNPSKRELDMLLTTGEQQSVALMAMCLESMGLPVVSLTGWQVGIRTDTAYGSARIRRVDTERLRRELDAHRIVLVTGFQGVNKYDDYTTLGRGGSDTTAVALAAALHADCCQIYTDVEGVYTTDPRKVPAARKLEEITYDEMLELASMGAQVLMNRSVEMAKRYGVELEVLSSLVRAPGTKVKEVVKHMEEMKITGIAKDEKVARITVMQLEDKPGTAFRVLNAVSKAGVNVDMIIQANGRDGANDMSFVVADQDVEAAQKALSAYPHVSVDTSIAKVSVVGAGMMSSVGLASLVFEALNDEHINIQMISTSEIKISCVIDATSADRAVAAIHRKFFEN
ncbi:MAG: aspartate kinase [Oscillospiraceae bacterium]|nr:aspartate kinase [Oscillospiraceae bacterium]